MKTQSALTPALSHMMGEGESSAVMREVVRLRICDALLKSLPWPIAVPTPVGLESVRVRVLFQ